MPLVVRQGFEATLSSLKMLEPDHAPGLRNLKKNIFKVSHKSISYVVRTLLHTHDLLSS